jgi:hypothetical protein
MVVVQPSLTMEHDISWSVPLPFLVHDLLINNLCWLQWMDADRPDANSLISLLPMGLIRRIAHQTSTTNNNIMDSFVST